MTRSIHTTRKDIERLERFDNEDKEKIEKCYDELAKKRRLKKHVKSRRSNRNIELSIETPDTIPIKILDAGKFIHYPASPEDIRGILQSIPGIFDGLSEIRLGLGFKEQPLQENEVIESCAAPDPFTGRIGHEILPDIFGGYCRGTYLPSKARIDVFAFVYDLSLPDIQLWEPYLRLEMLSVFLHEVAHHYDFMQRCREPKDSVAKAEIYAEGQQHKWVQQHAVEYVKRTYPDQVRHLEKWIEEYGGISLPLSVLIDDPRVTNEKGWTKCIFSVSSVLEILVKDVKEGTSKEKTQIEFSRQLHYGEHYEESLRILDNVLAENPKSHEAIILKAEIFADQDRYIESEAIIGPILLNNPNDLDALNVRRAKCLGSGDWECLLETMSHALKIVEPYSDDWQLFMRDRVGAKIELKDHDGAESDLIELEQNGGSTGMFWAKHLRTHAYADQ